MQLPASDQALIQLLLDSQHYSLNALARELDIHRNTLVRILDGTCQATHRTSSRLLAFYVAKEINTENSTESKQPQHL